MTAHATAPAAHAAEATTHAAQGTPLHTLEMVSETVKLWVLETAHLIASIAELAAVIIVAAALVEAVWRSFKVFAQRDRVPDEVKESLRLQMGRWLAISLEFLLAADILLTAVAPTWQEIGKLAAIAAIRTALNYFLQQEIEAHEKQHGRTMHPEHTTHPEHG